MGNIRLEIYTRQQLLINNIKGKQDIQKMARITTRINLRNDTLSNWLASTAKLNKGEVALARLSGELSDRYEMRVGVGNKNWSQLSSGGLQVPINNVTGLAEALSNVQYGIVFGTTSHWKSEPLFVPDSKQLVVWTDKGTLLSTVHEDGIDKTLSINVPGIKVGDGNAYNIDLPFVGDDVGSMLVQKLVEHEMLTSHIKAEERQSWNHKITIGSIDNPADDGVSNETLTITRI